MQPPSSSSIELQFSFVWKLSGELRNNWSSFLSQPTLLFPFRQNLRTYSSFDLFDHPDFNYVYKWHDFDFRSSRNVAVDTKCISNIKVRMPSTSLNLEQMQIIWIWFMTKRCMCCRYNRNGNSLVVYYTSHELLRGAYPNEITRNIFGSVVGLHSYRLHVISVTGPAKSHEDYGDETSGTCTLLHFTWIDCISADVRREAGVFNQQPVTMAPHQRTQTNRYSFHRADFAQWAAKASATALHSQRIASSWWNGREPSV